MEKKQTGYIPPCYYKWKYEVLKNFIKYNICKKGSSKEAGCSGLVLSQSFSMS